MSPKLSTAIKSANSDDLARLERIATALDRQYSVLGFKFGWDGLVGLVPVAGDLVTAGFGLFLIYEARRLGAGRWTIARMLLNLGVDLGGGSVPVVGDAFDFLFKSNIMNVRLLIADLERRERQSRNEGR